MSLGWAVGGAAAVGLVTYGVFAPRSGLLTPVIYRGPRDGRRRVALTFDDGPHPDATPAILDVLAELRAPATFFVIGLHAQRQPGTLRRMHTDGHLVGNHTFHHSWHGAWRGLSYWTRELRETGDVVESVIGERPALFRPPMGIKHGVIGWASRREGCRLVTWTRRGRDGWATTSDRILARLVGPAGAGDILTLHDGNDPHLNRDPSPTVAAVGPLVTGLRARGFELVRLDDLLGVCGYQRRL